MSAHVADEAVVDLATGEGGAEERAHAAACAGCAARVEEARASLELLQRTDVPEPSPFYWEALRRGVGRRISEERTWRPRLALLVPLAAAAAVAAVVFVGPQQPRPTPATPAPLAAWSPLPLAEEDESLSVLEGLALASGELAEWDEARGLSDYLAGLSDEESRALAETLEARGRGGDS